MEFNVYQSRTPWNHRGYFFFERNKMYFIRVPMSMRINSKPITEAVEQAKIKIRDAPIPPKGLKVILNDEE